MFTISCASLRDSISSFFIHTLQDYFTGTMLFAPPREATSGYGSKNLPQVHYELLIW